MLARLFLSLFVATPLFLWAMEDAHIAINPGVLAISGGSGDNIFLYDTFVDPNGTTLASHTGETGATWVTHSSFTTTTYQIRDNRAVTNNATATGMSYASGLPPNANYDIEAGMRVVSANYTAAGNGLAARVSTSPVNTMIFFRYSTSGFQCFQTVAGTSLQIGTSSSTTLTVGNDYALKLSVTNDVVTGSVDGVTVCSGTTTVMDAGRAGVRGNTASTTTGVHISDITGTSQ